MTRSSNPLPMLIGGVLVVAVLASLLVKGGWVIWLPVLLAVVVVLHLASTTSR